MLGGPQNHSEHGGGGKNSQPLPGLELPIIQPVAQRYTTEVSRLLNKKKYVEYPSVELRLGCLEASAVVISLGISGKTGENG
jgi:hypothetical protein